MKKNLLAVLGLAAIAGASSCSEDFNVAAPYRNTTVATGLFSLNDTANGNSHYIRIQKAFMDEHQSAYDMAKVSDSSFYPESAIEVKIKEISGANVVSTTILNRVDLAAEGFTKDDGTFFTSPNYGYKYQHSLNTAYIYRLIITNKNTGEVDSAQTGVITNDNTVFRVSEFTLNNYMITFTTVKEGQQGVFTWNVRTPPNSQTYDGIIRFRWVDKNTSTNEETDHYADWRFASNVLGTSSSAITLKVDYSSFFSFLAGAMGPAPVGIERYMDSCDLFCYAGDSTVYHYQQYASLTGGLTGDQIKPFYSNVRSSVKGTYPVGIFATRAYVSSFNVPIDPMSLDSLKVNPQTISLNIKGTSDH
ncbi:hypothetical protein [Taibaiella soli]|uniref:DUF4249 domain-containing protein n=1 Tax=Taibaiella soli TaxID=1649169 RepID=A0A2W2BAY2_9BACT|nr:hypothetical protein [Taibaiella soli]PZF73329.1 hypothetical protein DN068_09175 [Taibaiella soli]